MRACAIFKLQQVPGQPRVARDVLVIKTNLEALCTSVEPVFHADHGLIFGWLIGTAKPLVLIQRTVYNLGCFGRDDTLLLFEVGEAVEAIGFGRQKAWLQHALRGPTPRPDR